MSRSRTESAADREGDSRLAALRVEGYCVLPGLVPARDLALAREKLDEVYFRQEATSGREFLDRIQDADTARLPLAYDPWFIGLAAHPEVLALARAVMGKYIILSQQNGIINRPGEGHRQSVWHRDLPHQQWTSSRALALSALFCLDPFTRQTGCTLILPRSHREEQLPPSEYVERHAVPIEADAGSVIVFDCMVFHRAGANHSMQVRRAVNHMYTIPLIKQQIDLPKALPPGSEHDPVLAELLGYTSRSADSVEAWRAARSVRERT